MKKKLYKSGNGWALFLPKPILEKISSLNNLSKDIKNSASEG